MTRMILTGMGWDRTGSEVGIVVVSIWAIFVIRGVGIGGYLVDYLPDGRCVVLPGSGPWTGRLEFDLVTVVERVAKH